MTTSPWLYQYPPLQAGTLVKRYKRFFADIMLESGEVVTAHCPNTGPMTGIYVPGMPVQVSRSDNPKRKLAYTWEMVQVDRETTDASAAKTDPEKVWVGVNTALPNQVIRTLLAKRLISELGDYHQIQSEVPFGQGNRSRVDFLLTASPTIYLEVKNTTWTKGDLALFPDTVTTRGQKHLRELMDLLPQQRAVMLYFINRSDCLHFSPGDEADPMYGQLLREAIGKGLEVFPCRFEVTPIGIRYLGLASLEIPSSKKVGCDAT